MGKKKKIKEKQKELPRTPNEKLPEKSEEKPFDFGGLPSMNLKKNLGCG